MEAVLDVYCLPYNSIHPIVCMDEKPIQLIKEVRTPLPPLPGKPLRIDYEYERNGTANIFLFTEPLGGWRKVNIRERRTAIDWAEEIKELLDHDYPGTFRVGLVCDNLNTHKIASLYERFLPAEARRLAKRLVFYYTPKHGSWLNIAECELSVFSQQCLERRIPDISNLSNIGKTWAQTRNGNQKGVDWQFTTEDARIKLKRLYPKITV